MGIFTKRRNYKAVKSNGKRRLVPADMDTQIYELKRQAADKKRARKRKLQAELREAYEESKHKAKLKRARASGRRAAVPWYEKTDLFKSPPLKTKKTKKKKKRRTKSYDYGSDFDPIDNFNFF